MFRTWALCDSDDGGCGSAGHGGDGIRLWCIAEVVDGDDGCMIVVKGGRSCSSRFC